MPYCKYCGAKHDEDAVFCTECGKQIMLRKNHPETKCEETNKPIPGFPEPTDESERQVFDKMKKEKHRLLSKRETQIGDTLFVVYNSVPENCTDEQFQESCNKKIERLILGDLEHQRMLDREAGEQKKRTT